MQKNSCNAFPFTEYTIPPNCQHLLFLISVFNNCHQNLLIQLLLYAY